MEPARPSARGSVLRSLLLFAPFLAVTLVALAFLVLEVAENGASTGRIVGLTLVGFVSLLLAYQVIQSLRDVFARPVETRGRVERSWSRNEFFLFRNTYIFVERNVFRVPPDLLVEVTPGDTVRVVHYPHTATVEDLEVVERARRVGEGSRA